MPAITRKPVEEMSTDEIVTETLVLLRQFADVINKLGESPMARMLPGGVFNTALGPGKQSNGKR
jgi:hypothetical protein